jgi:glycosidase
MKKQVLQIQLSKFPTLLSGGMHPIFEFHILASIRKKYQVEETLFSSNGNLIFPNYYAVRLLAQKINAKRNLQKYPEQTIRTGQLNAMGLLDEIYHYVLRLYEETANPKVFARAEKKLDQAVGAEKVNTVLHNFGTLFPPLDVHLGKKKLESYLKDSTGNKPHTEITLEEIVLLYFANFNPAFNLFKELFDDKELNESTAYSKLITDLEFFFQTEKRFGPQNQFIFDLLREPILSSPNSLEGQLEYIKKHWGLILSEEFFKKILGAGDLIKEDKKIIFYDAPSTPPVPRYTYDELKGVGLLDLEKFTADLDWMPNVILLAKNVYVWLDQLSKKYKRSITKLNEIPDEELDQLSQWNLTALWLIGIWERSPASQKIKQWTGNPEAVSSAYSVYDYIIANDLGGEEAFENFRHRAGQRGIRLAGDMVPNHMGIYSKWIIEHPDYFIQSDYPPFPNYRFTDGNLSENPDIQVHIEDGYWSRSDASVVFQRVDNKNGNVRYIYHGNDGTHMPWNDTAQLDFLKAEVREAVMETIFHVARKFSIIRFDAAMTLTKRHFQRLWYPQPGSGGDIPSRSDHALTTKEFNQLFPKEFWREVVDRINHEMPNTLLLAEAFWLLEGYFVRTLGMHRVYNSAFMHMMMKEENSKYRELIRNTMHYNPEILKRYVNFMSNPDEETAMAQFGDGDKNFGVALLMVTLPGLPMFAHGQIEGYTEKYGMEYKRAYVNEEVQTNLISRHEREIFPLLSKRYLFSQVTFFEMYDFFDTHGNLNENVFAYSNKSGNERALVCYHNKYAETVGCIKKSVGRNVGSTSHPELIHRSLAEALELSPDEKVFYIFKDRKTQLEFIRSGRELHEQGLYVELKAFQYHVFLDFSEVYDSSGEYARLTKQLNGRGVQDLQEELQLMQLLPVHQKLNELINRERLELFQNICCSRSKPSAATELSLSSIVNVYREFLEQVKLKLNSSWDIDLVVEEFKSQIKLIRQLLTIGLKIDPRDYSAIDFTSQRNSVILFSWLISDCVERFGTRGAFYKLLIVKELEKIFRSFNFEKDIVEESVDLLNVIIFEDIYSSNEPYLLDDFFDSPEVQKLIKANEHLGVRYFNKERFEELMEWLFTISVIKQGKITRSEHKSRYNIFQKTLKASEESEYKFEEFKRAIKRESEDR